MCILGNVAGGGEGVITVEYKTPMSLSHRAGSTVAKTIYDVLEDYSVRIAWSSDRIYVQVEEEALTIRQILSVTHPALLFYGERDE